MNLWKILTYMSPSNLRRVNIDALYAKETLTAQEHQMLSDMVAGGAGQGGSAMTQADVVNAWRNKGY